MDDHRDTLERELERLQPGRISFDRLAKRRDRKRRNERVRAGVLGLAIAVAIVGLGVAAIRSASDVPADPPEELGIFAPVAGRIVYGDGDGIWGVDPDAPDPATRVQLTNEPGTPLGWSSDGTRLLIMQQIREGQAVTQDRDSLRLLVLDAAGSVTQVAERQNWITGAAISPDGSRVVFGTYQALYSVDVDGGRPVVLLDGGEDELETPTFAPDGTEIAFVAGSGDHSHRVLVMDADGSDVHEILANETTMGAGHVRGLAWSPAGDRIAFGNDVATYTFAPDGSDFRQVLADGTRPFWSPDGSQLAYSTGSLAIAGADGSNARAFGFADSGPWHPAFRSAPPTPADPTLTRAELGIFADVRGWIAFQHGRELWAVAPDGSEQTVLLDGRKDLGVEDWSPDGSRLLVTPNGGDGPRWDLAVIEPDGSETTLVRFDDNDTYFEGASFSPDGATVVYARWAKGDGNQLLTVASDGSGEPRLLLSEGGNLSEPTYSPDGTQVAYVAGGGDHSHTINVVNADGTDVRVLIDATPPFDAASHIFGLDWSPDGSLIAVGLGDGPEAQGIYTVRPDGTDLSLLIPGGKDPAWSPDGSLIAYSPYVSVANADGSDRRILSSFGGAGPWNPGAPADGA